MKYLHKERNLAPWQVAQDAFVITARLLAIDLRVVAGFGHWVNNLVLPYIYETGGFKIVEEKEEEELHLKAKMVEFACIRWAGAGGLNKQCLLAAQKQFFDWMDGKEEIHSYLRGSILQAALESIDTRVEEVYTFFKGNRKVFN